MNIETVKASGLGLRIAALALGAAGPADALPFYGATGARLHSRLPRMHVDGRPVAHGTRSADPSAGLDLHVRLG